ncbi:MAG: tRNA1(Val) (adenine(37)-N6)-methyltransferase [Thermodesulfobacteriota bacterium]|nr:tRNA1(Val) (adenine(37)-N6)-methyltransferase [Thermodesulfobacteriota bacterium]
MKKLSWSDQEETLDTLLRGRLKILQKKSGYRFSIDALLLAHFTEVRLKDCLIDLGTGCGILPLILTCRKKAERVIGVEIQPSLADLARRNAALNHLSSRIEIWEKDLKTLKREIPGGTFDVVVSNPPYRKVGSGRINPGLEKALARHEIKAALNDILKAAHHLLKEKGRLNMIYPASRAADLIQEMRKSHLEPKRLQFIHSHQKDEARLMLVEAIKEGHAQIKVLPPRFLYDSAGGYTSEAQDLFR